MADRPSATVPARPGNGEPLADSTTIEVLAMAIHDVCGLLTDGQLEEIRRSVEQACLMPKEIEWDRRAAAHAEIFGLLADAAGHPFPARMLNFGVGFMHQLMTTAGPVAGMMAANSSKRLLASLYADDAEGAAHEVERHLTALRVMGRLANCS